MSCCCCRCDSLPDRLTQLLRNPAELQFKLCANIVNKFLALLRKMLDTVALAIMVWCRCLNIYTLGPRTRRAKSKDKKTTKDPKTSIDEKRPRTAFTSEQLEKLRLEFQANSYLDEKRRKDLAERLCLNENQIKIWFQNKRAKIKKQSNQPNPLRGLLVAGGLYNHSTATSDCSESYVNGLDHDVGNQALDDVDYAERGGVDDDDCEQDNNNRNDFRERNPSSELNIMRKSSTSSGNKRRRPLDDEACGNNNNEDDDGDDDENSNHLDANDGDHDYNDDLVGLKQQQQQLRQQNSNKRARLDRMSNSDLGEDDERVISVN